MSLQPAFVYVSPAGECLAWRRNGFSLSFDDEYPVGSIGALGKDYPSVGVGYAERRLKVVALAGVVPLQSV